VIDAIQLGQPTAIFEDALPNQENFPIARGTFLPRIMPRGGSDAADANQLFKALDIDYDFIERNVAPNQTVKFPWLIWKATANPYPRDPQLDTPELVIVRDDKQASELTTHFSTEHPATRGITELCFQYASYINAVPNAELKFEPLVITGSCGRILLFDYLRAQSPEQRESFRGSAGSNYALAAHITGTRQVTEIPESASSLKADKQTTNVILVADIDLLADMFVDLRNFPIRNGIDYQFQNMSFFQNIVDSLVDEDTYGDLRNRKQKHVTLREVEKTTEKALQDVYAETQRIQKEAATAQEAETVKVNAEIGPLQEEIKQLEARQARGEPIDLAALNYKKQILSQTQLGLQQKIQSRMEELGNGVRENIRGIELDAELKIQQIQRQFKLAAVILPPIPPLLVGLIVFTRRRLREREGISKARRLK
jgi:ABC-2 type transport system permease protein